MGRCPDRQISIIPRMQEAIRDFDHFDIHGTDTEGFVKVTHNVLNKLTLSRRAGETLWQRQIRWIIRRIISHCELHSREDLRIEPRYLDRIRYHNASLEPLAVQQILIEAISTAELLRNQLKRVAYKRLRELENILATVKGAVLEDDILGHIGRLYKNVKEDDPIGDDHPLFPRCDFCFDQVFVFEAHCCRKGPITHRPHHICRHCIMVSFKVATNDTTWPPKCCHKYNAPHFKIDDFIIFFDEEFLEECREKEREFEIAIADRIYCSEPKCSAIIVWQEIKGTVGTCSKCEQKTCIICKTSMEKHRKGERCPDDSDTKALKKLIREKKWQKCPTCLTITERIDGCLHMECPICGDEFCYNCGSRWLDEYCECRANPIFDMGIEGDGGGFEGFESEGSEFGEEESEVSGFEDDEDPDQLAERRRRLRRERQEEAERQERLEDLEWLAQTRDRDRRLLEEQENHRARHEDPTRFAQDRIPQELDHFPRLEFVNRTFRLPRRRRGPNYRAWAEYPVQRPVQRLPPTIRIRGYQEPNHQAWRTYRAWHEDNRERAPRNQVAQGEEDPDNLSMRAEGASEASEVQTRMEFVTIDRQNPTRDAVHMQGDVLPPNMPDYWNHARPVPIGMGGGPPMVQYPLPQAMMIENIPRPATFELPWRAPTPWPF